MTPDQFLNAGKPIGLKPEDFLGSGSFTVVQPTKQKSGVVETIKDIPSDIKGAFDEAANSVMSGRAKMSDAFKRGVSGESDPLSAGFQTVGAAGKTVGGVVGAGFKGVVKSFLSPKSEQQVSEKINSTGSAIGNTDIAFEVANWYSKLTPEQKRNVDAAGGIAEGLTTILGVPAGKIGSTVASRTGSAALNATGKGLAGTAKITGKAASEIQGAYTGTSAETISQAFGAARRGGQELEKFTKYLRGEATPENLVLDVRNATEQLSQEKSARFGEMLAQIGTQQTDTSSVITGVKNDLKRIGVKVNDDGTLDFSESKFRTVPNAANKLQAMYDEVARFGSTATIGQVDTSRQALKALLLSGDDASANTANLAINGAVDRVRNAGLQVQGYGEALTRYGEDAQFLDELGRSLSTGDQATIDTAYRKLATTLKTNNEQRMTLLKELDNLTGGYVLSSIAGQQLSEQLPRGMFRQILAGAAGLSALTGGVSMAAIPALVFASPRVTGEILRAMGIAAHKVDNLVDAFGKTAKMLKVNVAQPVKEYTENIQPGLSTRSVPLHPDDQQMLTRFIDSVRLKGKSAQPDFSDADFAGVQALFSKLGKSPDTNLNKLANFAEDILSGKVNVSSLYRTGRDFK